MAIDPMFQVEAIRQTPDPQQVIFAAMHQDYAEGFVWDEREKFPSEQRCGELIVNNLLAGGRGHFGPLEHPQIVLNCGWFPHSTMQQVRTHRLLSFDVQSFRYTGKRIIDAAEGEINIEDVFYLRPPGIYSSRHGGRYQYTEEMRESDLIYCCEAVKRYASRVTGSGFSEEHARGLIPFDVRQHWVMSANVRSLMHLLDLRAKDDAQLECQQLCELIWPHFEAWVPAIAEWYKKNRWKRARLAP